MGKMKNKYQLFGKALILLGGFFLALFLVVNSEIPGNATRILDNYTFWVLLFGCLIVFLGIKVIKQRRETFSLLRWFMGLVTSLVGLIILVSVFVTLSEYSQLMNDICRLPNYFYLVTSVILLFGGYYVKEEGYKPEIKNMDELIKTIKEARTEKSDEKITTTPILVSFKRFIFRRHCGVRMLKFSVFTNKYGISPDHKMYQGELATMNREINYDHIICPNCLHNEKCEPNSGGDDF